MVRYLGPLLLTGLLCAAEPESRPTTEPASRPAMTPQRRAQLKQWIDQLGDESYDVRQKATEQLQKAADAVELLAAAYAATKDAEVIDRIEHIGRRLFFDVISRLWQPGFLGVEPQTVTDVDEPQVPKDSIGIKLADVVEDTPARKAGLKIGDVIIRFNGKTLPKDMLLTGFTERVMALGAGKRVAVELVRDGKRMTLHVTLASRMQFIPTEFQAEDETKFQAWWRRHFTRPPEGGEPKE